jgi:hypothetical protein
MSAAESLAGVADLQQSEGHSVSKVLVSCKLNIFFDELVLQFHVAQSPRPH